jgi:hypothetical protein
VVFFICRYIHNQENRTGYFIDLIGTEKPESKLRKLVIRAFQFLRKGGDGKRQKLFPIGFCEFLKCLNLTERESKKCLHPTERELKLKEDKMNFKKVVISVVFASLVCLPQALWAGEHLPGDFHQHTLYTDGSDTFDDVMDSNVDYGLVWWANSEHGGERNRDGYGDNWDDPAVYPVNPIVGWYEESGGHQEMWRWQSLRDYVFPGILETREIHTDKTIISGLEWNVPGHEHCSTGIVGDDATAISAFEYQFDGSDEDLSREGEMTPYGTLYKQNGLENFVQMPTFVDSDDKSPEDAHTDSVAAVAWMQTQKDEGLIKDGYIVFAHIERKGGYDPANGKFGYNVTHFRDYNNAGPEVAFGFEGAPGHQTSSDRGFRRTADGDGTYGGSGWHCAEVGGLWDALLGEGRNWWNFASSDYHRHWTANGSDFWPGEYQKNYTYIDTNNPEREVAVVEGLRSGNSWHVEGDLIDELDFTAHGQGKTKAMMGQTLEVKAGKMVTIKIKAHDPITPNFCPLDMDNPSLAQVGISQPLNMPVLDHIDLIAGEWGDKIDPSDPAYAEATNPTAEVVATFERHGGINKNGYLNYVYKFKAEAGENLYFRLRGTNVPADVPFETDEMGNPLADTEANDNLYAMMNVDDLAENLFPGYENISFDKLDEVAEAYADLWFYSNPIFVKVVD